MGTMRKAAGVAATVILVMAAATSMFAQAPKTWNGGGTVTDAKGNGVTGVAITLADTKTPTVVAARATTDASGNYSFKNLSGSVSYKVTPTPTKGGYQFSPASGAINWTHPQANFKASK